MRLWIINNLHIFSFQNGLQDFVFLVFVVLLAAFWIFTFKFVPETKNKSFEEITALFRKDAPQTNYSSNVNEKNYVSSNGSYVGDDDEF